MTTIPKNSRSITRLRAELTQCVVRRESNDYADAACDPRHAWEALRTGIRARLRDNGNGTYTVHIPTIASGTN